MFPKERNLIDSDTWRDTYVLSDVARIIAKIILERIEKLLAFALDIFLYWIRQDSANQFASFPCLRISILRQLLTALRALRCHMLHRKYSRNSKSDKVAFYHRYSFFLWSVAFLMLLSSKDMGKFRGPYYYLHYSLRDLSWTSATWLWT